MEAHVAHKPAGRHAIVAVVGGVVGGWRVTAIDIEFVGHTSAHRYRRHLQITRSITHHTHHEQRVNNNTIEQRCDIRDEVR